MIKMLLASTALVHCIPAAFMTDACPTVMVVMNGTPVRINKSDYDENPDNFQLVDGDDGSGSDPRIDANTPTPMDQRNEDGTNKDGGEVILTDEEKAFNDIVSNFNPGVLAKGRKFVIVDQAREGKIVDDIPGINDGDNAKGYDSQDVAWRTAFEVKARNTSNANTQPNPNLPDTTTGGNPAGDAGNQQS